MMKKKIVAELVIFLLAATLLWCGGEAQPLPKIHSVTITPRVTFDRSSGLFTYTYHIRNSPESIGSVGTIWFDIFIPEGGEDPGDPGVPDDIKIIIDREMQAQTYEERKGEIVPMAFVQAPPGWDGGYTGTGPGVFGAPVGGKLRPGQSAGPFVIKSKGVAGIRGFMFRPRELIKAPNLEEIPGEEETNKALAEYSQALKSARFVTKSVGPTALPKNCDPPCIVEFLMAQKEQAFQLGWIDNPGVANSLNKKLAHAKRRLSEGLKYPAINILHAFIHELQAQEGTHVNDSAFAFLKANTEFLIFKLESR